MAFVDQLHRGTLDAQQQKQHEAALTQLLPKLPLGGASALGYFRVDAIASRLIQET